MEAVNVQINPATSRTANVSCASILFQLVLNILVQIHLLSMQATLPEVIYNLVVKGQSF